MYHVCVLDEKVVRSLDPERLRSVRGTFKKCPHWSRLCRWALWMLTWPTSRKRWAVPVAITYFAGIQYIGPSMALWLCMMYSQNPKP